jgi:hypothetical protein
MVLRKPQKACNRSALAAAQLRAILSAPAARIAFVLKHTPLLESRRLASRVSILCRLSGSAPATPPPLLFYLSHAFLTEGYRR